MSADLLPCAHCGGAALMHEHPAHSHAGGIAGFMPDYPGSFTIECAACNCGMINNTAEAVSEAWNRRAPVQAQGVALTDDPFCEQCQGFGELREECCPHCNTPEARALLAQSQPADHVGDARQMVGADDARDLEIAEAIYVDTIGLVCAFGEVACARWLRDCKRGFGTVIAAIGSAKP